MSFELSQLGTSTDVLSKNSLAPVLDEGSLTTSLTGLGRSNQSLLFVDKSVTDYQQLLAGVTPGTEIHILDPGQDGVTQITNTLLGRQNIASLHIVSHGKAGGVDFGSSAFNSIDLPQYAAQLKTWSKALTNDADILFYGCNVAQGQLGQAFVQNISQVTGADVAASDDLTGNSSLGGDWNLEVATGTIESSPIFSADVLNSYQGTLAYTLGARHTVSGGDVFLGGEFIELGVKGDAGFFGTAASKPANFFGTSARNNIGLSIDPDGYQTGSTFSYDVFLPGSPYEGWSIGYQQSDKTYSLENAGARSTQIASTTADTSSGNTLAATVTSNTTQNVSVVQTYSFDYTQDYWKTAVTITNNSATAIDNLRYARAYDPDNARDSGGSFTTTNTIVNTIAADGKVILSAQVPSSDSSFATYGARPSYFISFDPSARAFLGSTDINSLSTGTKGETVTQDSNISLWFDIGTLAAGASKTVQFYTGLSTNILAAAANAPTNTVPGTQSTNAGTPITFGGSNAISVADSDSTNLTVKLTATNGTTSLSGVTGLSFASGDGTTDSTMTFSGTKTDINTALNNLVFNPTKDFSGAASIQIETSDGDFSDADTVNITVNAVNIQPTISTNSLSLSEGGSVVLSSSNINATDPDNTPAQLTYTASSISGGQFELVANAGVAITSFTQAQINSGAVRFVHGGGETAPSYSLSVNDGLLSSGSSTVAIGTFTNVNDAPTISTNSLSLSEGGSVVLSSSNINATDPDNTPAQLTYTASSISGGQFELVANAGVAITSFTQAQINSGAVRFVHGGGKTAPSYSLSVSDGLLSSGSSTSVTQIQSLPNILWRNKASGENTIWEMNGFSLESNNLITQVADQNWQIAGTADFNGDGKSDILWRNKASGENTIWGLNGFSVQSNNLITQVADQNWQIAGTADFNGDGKSDILWRNKASGENTIWEMNGFSVQSNNLITQVADQNWQIAGTADFNGDGKSDILWRNKASGENTIWGLNGFSVQSNNLITQVADQNWQIAGTADFNGDGKSDILWRNKASGENTIWGLNGFSVQSNNLITQVADQNWQIALTADFNGDGKSDILWRNEASRENTIWGINGFSVQSNNLITQRVDQNWKIVGRV